LILDSPIKLCKLTYKVCFIYIQVKTLWSHFFGSMNNLFFSILSRQWLTAFTSSFFYTHRRLFSVQVKSHGNWGSNYNIQIERKKSAREERDDEEDENWIKNCFCNWSLPEWAHRAPVEYFCICKVIQKKWKMKNSPNLHKMRASWWKIRKRFTGWNLKQTIWRASTC
jgi:hypothetical protein